MVSFREINNIIEAIPERTFGGTQPEFLFNLSMNLHVEGEVVEIGTNVGKSTIALGFAQKSKNGNPVTTIDIFQHPDIEKNLKQAGVSEFVSRIVSPSHVAARQWNKPIKLLWIDGDHSYRGVLGDINNWTKFVVTHGVVALHDYPGHLGSNVVYRAVMKSPLMNPYQYRMLHDREAGSIIVFQKIDPEEKENTNVSSQLYWTMREARSWFIRTFPGVSQRIIKRFKEKGGKDG